MIIIGHVVYHLEPRICTDEVSSLELYCVAMQDEGESE